MKLIQTLIILFSIIISMASAIGVAEEQNRDRTGSPDGSTTCSACHTGGGYNPSLIIILEDSNGESVSNYIPGEDYTLKFMITSIPFPTVYGFQATVLFADLSDAGILSDPGPGAQLEEVNTIDIPSRHIVEHSNPGFIGNYQVQWTAPMNGDDVTVYASAVTANGNNEPEGDKATSSILVIPAADPIGISESIVDNIKLIHTKNEWKIQLPVDHFNSKVSLLNSNGAIIAELQAMNSIDHSSLPAGIYFIIVEVSGESKTFKALSL